MAWQYAAFSHGAYKALTLLFQVSRSRRMAGVIDCRVGQINHSSDTGGVYSRMTFITRPDSRSSDILRQDFTAIPCPAMHQRRTRSPSLDARLPFIFTRYFEEGGLCIKNAWAATRTAHCRLGRLSCRHPVRQFQLQDYCRVRYLLG